MSRCYLNVKFVCRCYGNVCECQDVM